jgi:hypothetical protein
MQEKLETRELGAWLREIGAFEKWQNSKVSCGIWLKGALRTGKTVLMSIVIDHMT